MTERKRVASVAELQIAGRKLVSVGELRIALFWRSGRPSAFLNRCPHRGGPVGAGPLRDDCLTCPWHGLEFRLSDGRCVNDSATPGLTFVAATVQDDEVWIELPEPEPDPDRDGIRRYLVRYGVTGQVALFGTVDDLPLTRGDHAVVATHRGTELGEVLFVVADGSPETTADDGDSNESAGRSLARRRPTGEILRPATATDRHVAGRRDGEYNQLLEAAQQSAAERKMPVSFVAGEVLFDNRTVVLYFLGTPSETLGPLAVALSDQAGDRQVQLEPLESGTSSGRPAGLRPLDKARRKRELKGPYERLKYDLRRVWECPVCQHRERSSGKTTTMFCRCQEEVDPLTRRSMRLVEDGVRRVGPVAPPVDVSLDDDDVAESTRSGGGESRQPATAPPSSTAPPDKSDAGAQSEAAQSETAQSEAAQSEAAQSEAAQSEAAQSEAAQSEAAQSEAAQSEAAQSEAAQSEAAQSEAAQSEAAQSEAPQSEAAQSEAAQSEAAQSEAAAEPTAGSAAETARADSATTAAPTSAGESDTEKPAETDPGPGTDGDAAADTPDREGAADQAASGSGGGKRGGRGRSNSGRSRRKSKGSRRRGKR